MGDLTLTPGRTNGHFADGGLRRGHTEGDVVVQTAAAGVGAEAQCHRIGLVRGGAGTKQGLRIGSTGGIVTDDHRVAHAGIVVTGRYTGGIGRVVGAVTQEDIVGIHQGQAVAGVGTDHHFLGAVGKGAVTDDHLVVLGGIDGPAIDARQAQCIQAGLCPGRCRIRQYQTQQTVRVAIVDVGDIAVRGRTTQNRQMRVGAGGHATQTVKQGADRAEVDHWNAQHIGHRVGLDNVGRADGRVAVAHVAITAEQVLQRRPQQGADRADQTAGTDHQPGRTAGTGDQARVAGRQGHRRHVRAAASQAAQADAAERQGAGRRHRCRCRIAGDLADQRGQPVGHPAGQAVDRAAKLAAQSRTAGNTTDSTQCATVNCVAGVIDRSAHRTDRTGQVGVFQVVTDIVQAIVQRTGQAGDCTGQSLRTGDAAHHGAQHVAHTADHIAHTGQQAIGHFAQTGLVQQLAHTRLDQPHGAGDAFTHDVGTVTQGRVTRPQHRQDAPCRRTGLATATAGQRFGYRGQGHVRTTLHIAHGSR